MPSMLENVDRARLRALGIKTLRTALIGVSGLLGLGAVAVAVLFIALQITPVRTALGDRVLATLADGDGITLELEGYGGVWPVRLRADTLSVRDGGVLIAEVQDLDLSWSPFAVLGGLVHVDDLTARRVVLNALPQGEDAPDEAPGPLIPSLPVDVRIDALTLADIQLAAGIAGDAPVALSARGQALLAGGHLKADISAARTDGGVFDLAVKADINPETDVFNADIALRDGAPGAPGLIAALTGNADLDVVTVTAAASGPVDEWVARVDAQAGRLGRFEASLNGDRREGGSVRLDAGFDPGAVLAGLPTPLTASASISHQNSSYVASNISAGAGEAGFAGQVSLADPLASLRLQLDGTVVNLSSVVDITFPEIISLRADMAADANLTQIDVAALDIEANGLAASFAGAVDRAQRVARGELHLQTQDIRPLADLAGVAAAGAFRLHADLDALTFDGGLDGNVTADLTPTRLPVEGLLEVVGDTLAVEGSFAALDARQGTRIEALSLVASSGLVAAQAHGDVSPDAVDVQVSLEAGDMAGFSALAGLQLAGRASLAGDVSGALGRLAVTGSLTLAEVRIAGVPIDGVARAALAVGDGVEGPVGFTGRVADADADIGALFVSQAGRTALADLAGHMLDIKVAGSAAVEPGGALMVDIRGDITSLRALGRALGSDLDGTGSFEVASVPGDRGNTLEAKASLRTLSAAGIEVRRVGLTASVSPAARISAQADLRRISVGNITVARGEVDVSGPGERLALGVGMTGISTFEDQNGTGTLDLSALYEGRASRVTLSALDGVLAGVPVTLAAPAVVSLREGVRVNDLTVRMGQGQVQLDAVQGRGALDVASQIEDAPLALLVALSGQTSEVRGTLSGDMRLTASGSTGSGKVDVKIAPVTPGAVAGEAAALPVFLLDADWDGRTARARVTADMPGAEDLVAKASLPVTVRQGRPYLARRAALDARLKGMLDLGAVWPILPVDGHVMTGLVDMDMTARGPFADMDIAGTAHMRNGSYEGLETGIILTPMAISLVTRNGQAEIDVETRDGASGILKGRGRFDLRDSADDRLKVTLDMTSFRVLGRDDLSAVASGDIQVVWPRGEDGQAQPLTVGGAVTIESLDAQIPDQLASDVETIEVTRVSADGEPIDPQADTGDEGDEGDAGAAGEAAAIVLSLSVDVPRAAFVRGRGLESEWAGDLNIAGAVTAPVLRGAFRVQRGTFDFLGQSFDLTGGRIEFTGGEEIDPYLDVKAVYEDDDFQAIVTVTGPSSNPRLDVSSMPVLPQDEILARILFGTGTGQLTAFQAVQLADAAATLAGANTGGGVLDTMRRALGVDVLSVGESGLEVGSYVRDGVYVGVSQGLDAGTGEVTVEVELTGEISLESDVGAAGDTSVGVTWGRDY